MDTAAQPPAGSARAAPDSTPPGDGATDPTARLWSLRSPRSAAVASAAALTGVDVATLSAAASVVVAASPEASALLHGMEARIRMLPTAVATSSERCVNSVRGPILWAETITARANALGNDDVFVCMTTERTFDRVENQLLVDALTSIAAARRVVDGPAGAHLEPAEVDRVSRVACEAARWRGDPRFAGLRGGRLSGRGAARIRGGHRRAAMAPVLELRQRAREPFSAHAVAARCDRWTRSLHHTAVQVLESLEGPRLLTLSDGGLWCRTVSFRHPRTSGPEPAGLSIRGVPVTPPLEHLSGAPWLDRIRTDGVVIPVDATPPEVAEILDVVATGTRR